MLHIPVSNLNIVEHTSSFRKLCVCVCVCVCGGGGHTIAHTGRTFVRWVLGISAPSHQRQIVTTKEHFNVGHSTIWEVCRGKNGTSGLFRHKSTQYRGMLFSLTGCRSTSLNIDGRNNTLYLPCRSFSFKGSQLYILKPFSMPQAKHPGTKYTNTP